MSWTDAFPVMSEEMVEEFENLATPEERAELEEWYGVKEIFNAQDKPHLVSFSLFWKPSAASKKVYPKPTREILMIAGELGLDLRFEPWPHYIQPVLDEVPKILEKLDDVVVRVYLAADLDFLIEDFVNVGCEVYLMRHPSLAHAPGIAWRVLAFEEKGRLVTMVDSDRLKGIAPDIMRTRLMQQTGFACWREPVSLDHDLVGKIIYKPIMGCQLGLVSGWPIKRLLHAFTWHSIRGNISTMIELPGCRLTPISNGHWPDYGFEEWFLAVAMYPRWAAAGMLTFVPFGFHSSLLLLDIEYATWANPKSELIIFPTGSCCASTPVLDTDFPETATENAEVALSPVLETIL
jgi:hypothetical protein